MVKAKDTDQEDIVHKEDIADKEQIAAVLVIVRDSPTSRPASDPDFHVPIVFGLEFQEKSRISGRVCVSLC